MAVAQGECPNCGAAMEFGVGSSIAKVCDFCRATVVRSDRGLENLGVQADIANTPTLIAIGDQGTLGERQFEVLGRVQLDHGKGPWDEFYVSFQYGDSWGWLAYAQGQWIVTEQAHGLAIPPFNTLHLEMDVPLGQMGTYRVVEKKVATIVSAEGELPGAIRPQQPRHYADCHGPNNSFATLDYGDNQGAYSVFVGWIFGEGQMQVTQAGERTTQKVKTDMMKCPQCGGDVPKLTGDRAKRLGCPYCGAVSDTATQQIVAQQEAAMAQPDIPVTARGMLEGVEYVCIAYVRRGTDFDGDPYSWEEYLLWNQQVGYRWLVKDPETGWQWVMPSSAADMDFSQMPNAVSWGGRAFTIRNQGYAEVQYVLGEMYWQCEVGERTTTADYVNGRDVLSREEGPTEVHWSYSSPVAWAMLAQAFNLPVDGPGGQFGAAGGGAVAAGGSGGGCTTSGVLLLVIIVVLLICMLAACGACSSGGGGGYSSGGVYRSGGYSYSGGK